MNDPVTSVEETAELGRQEELGDQHNLLQETPGVLHHHLQETPGVQHHHLLTLNTNLEVSSSPAADKLLHLDYHITSRYRKQGIIGRVSPSFV